MTTISHKPPVPRYIAWLATAMLGLTAVAVVTDLRRVRTGELLVQSDANDVRITIRRDGQVVVPSTDRRSFTLPPGAYDVDLDAPPAGLTLSPRRVVVPRNARAVVRVRRAE